MIADLGHSDLCVQAIGNHEFDNGVDGLVAPFMKEVEFAVLSANIRPDHSLAATFGASCLPYKIFTVGGEKVGVVGYTSQETPALSRPGESRLVLLLRCSQVTTCMKEEGTETAFVGRSRSCCGGGAVVVEVERW